MALSYSLILKENGWDEGLHGNKDNFHLSVHLIASYPAPWYEAMHLTSHLC